MAVEDESHPGDSDGEPEKAAYGWRDLAREKEEDGKPPGRRAETPEHQVQAAREQCHGAGLDAASRAIGCLRPEPQRSAMSAMPFASQ